MKFLEKQNTLSLYKEKKSNENLIEHILNYSSVQLSAHLFIHTNHNYIEGGDNNIISAPTSHPRPVNISFCKAKKWLKRRVQ